MLNSVKIMHKVLYPDGILNVKTWRQILDYPKPYFVAGHKMIRLLPLPEIIILCNYLILIANLKKDKAKSFRPFTAVAILVSRVIKK